MYQPVLNISIFFAIYKSFSNQPQQETSPNRQVRF